MSTAESILTWETELESFLPHALTSRVSNKCYLKNLHCQLVYDRKTDLIPPSPLLAGSRVAWCAAERRLPHAY